MGETHIAGKSHQLWERLSRACQSIIGDVDRVEKYSLNFMYKTFYAYTVFF